MVMNNDVAGQLNEESDDLNDSNFTDLDTTNTPQGNKRRKSAGKVY